MAFPQKTVNVRLTPELTESFERLKEAIPGLPKGALLRSLLADQFAKPLDMQIELVTRQLLRPAARKPRTRSGAGSNTRNRIAAGG